MGGIMQHEEKSDMHTNVLVVKHEEETKFYMKHPHWFVKRNICKYSKPQPTRL